MRKEPINYNNPLGISKREWTLVLGVNLVLLLLTYVIATILTINGNDFFMLKAENAYLQRIEDTLRQWNVFALVQIAYATLEETILLTFACFERPKFWWPLAHYGLRVVNNLLWFNLYGSVPAWSTVVINAAFAIFVILMRFGRKSSKPLLRFAIGLALAFPLNGIIMFFRTRMLDMYHVYTNITLFYLSVEYYLALSLVLGLLAIAIPWNKTKGDQRWATTPPAGGSSPTLTNSLPKNSPSAKNPSNLSPKIKKHLKIMRAKVFVIQTVAFIVIAFFPWFVGRPVEFAMAELLK